jgi:hypothetical protein
MKKMLIVTLFAFLFAFNVNAANLSDLSDGAIIRTVNNPDIYIIKYSGGKSFKRLVLNPMVFDSYQHLKWDNVLVISQEDMDKFTTSDLVKVYGTDKVYQLVASGDSGNKYTVIGTNYNTNSVYIINNTDFENYTYKGTVGELEEESSETVVKEEDTGTTDTTSTRESEVSEALSDIDSRISKMKTRITEYETRIEVLESEIARINLPGVTSLSTKDRIKRLGEECAKIKEVYTPLKEKQTRLKTIKYEFEDYIKDGTKVPAEDRTYLDNLSDEEEAEVKAAEDAKKADEDKASRKAEASPVLERIDSMSDEIDEKWEEYEDTEEAYARKIRNLEEDIAVGKEGGKDTTTMQTERDKTVKEREAYVNLYNDDQHKVYMLNAISSRIKKYIETGTPIHQGHRTYLIEDCGIDSSLPTNSNA